jgi:uncharacterized protein (TIGR04255 family)
MKHMTSNSNLATLPSYKNPPINEVVCGMLFQTPENLRIPHIGLIWDKFRQEYPIIQHAMPIAGAKGEFLVDPVTGIPTQRIWFINKADDQLIQFQFDRFYFNWRRRKNDYPRYSHVIKNFQNTHDTFEKFFKEFNLGELRPTGYELSYINHIPKGEGWNTLKDLPKVFTDFVWKEKTGRFLPNPVNITWQTIFPLDGTKGQLIVSLRQATRIDDKIPLLLLDLTARGIDESKDKKAFREWFDSAREWIVRGFADLTSSEVQKVYWGREDA